MNVIKKANYLLIEFSDGKSFSTDANVDSLWELILANAKDEKALKKIIFAEESSEEELINRLNNSNILTLRGNSVYMLDVSELSIPKDFVNKILEAEENNDIQEINKYKNFWTLVSLNPDSRVRNNIFWFIRKWDMKITEAGLIVAYRNADIKEKAKYTLDQVKAIVSSYYEVKYLNHENPYEEKFEINNQNFILGELYDEIVNGAGSPIYTDRYSHTTTITLGHPVSMPRKDVDGEQENSCSSGLHCASKGWLKANYYGDVGLMVLVNPANVVAVPR